MLIHLPAAIGYCIREYPVGQYIIFIQQIIPFDSSAFAISRNESNPIQIQIFHTVVSHIFQMIPYAVHTFQQFITDFLTVTDNIFILTTQFNPPISGVHIGKVWQSPASFFEFGQLTAFHMGGNTVRMFPVFQIFLRVMVCPFRTHKFYRLSTVHSGKQQSVSHRIAVRFFRSIGFLKFVSSFTAHTPRRTAHGS